jgi:hypothetical protein
MNAYDKNTRLMNSLLVLAANFPKPGKKSQSPSMKYVRRSKHRRGHAVQHTPVPHFKPVFLFKYKDKPLVPALFRRLHMGVQVAKTGK